MLQKFIILYAFDPLARSEKHLILYAFSEYVDTNICLIRGDVKDFSECCQPKVEMSYSYQDRNVRF